MPSSPYFNPRSPCGERQSRLLIYLLGCYFNPRSPCGERLPEDGIFCPYCGKFQSTLPVWGATWGYLDARRARREFQSTLPVWGATGRVSSSRCRYAYFNPRSPCGERHPLPSADQSIISISIHAPRVGSDVMDAAVGIESSISIHAPRVGSDGATRAASRLREYFNPRSPCGERRSPKLPDSRKL